MSGDQLRLPWGPYRRRKRRNRRREQMTRDREQAEMMAAQQREQTPPTPKPPRRVKRPSARAGAPQLPHRPHLGRRVVRGLSQVAHWDYGAQAVAGSELASAVAYVRDLVHWYEAHTTTTANGEK